MVAQVRPQALQEPLDERLAAAAFSSCSRSMTMTVPVTGAGDSPVKLRPGDGAGRDLLGEDPDDARGPQRVDLGVKRLADGRGAGVPDPHVPGRHHPGRRRAGQEDIRQSNASTRRHL